MESAWIDFAVATAPRFAVAGFLAGFGIWSFMWLIVRGEGNRTVPLSMSIMIGLGSGLCSAVLVGGAVAALAYPLLFLMPLPVEIHSFLVGLLSTEEINYWWVLGIIATMLLLPVVGCVWLEAGREPPPSVDPPFSPLAHQDHVVWSYLIADQQLAPAFDASIGRNSKKAFEVFKRFADQGNGAAQNNVGVMFETGFGVEKSDAQAEQYFCRAAEQGVRTGQFNLAALLVGDILRAGASQHSSDTDRRLVEGFKWALIAKAQHYPGVSLRGFRRRMNRKQIAEGESLAQLWLQQHEVQKQSKLGFLIEEAPRVLGRELSSFHLR